jgi:hypothetical protein
VRRWAKLRRGVMKHFLISQFNYAMRKREIDAARRERWRKCREWRTARKGGAPPRASKDPADGAMAYSSFRALPCPSLPCLRSAPQAHSS